ncbi:M28 family peptidase [Thalassotalea nanhaiensis]|uniref:M28 family peptidase n=1 Tax=Thalassotalea nanhaiensis TaxID=3065648 RepID=A0ABY9TCX2_9GAMM|nr:M28 family peptidase [Colwelliaceae bacterium SQ345]
MFRGRSLLIVGVVCYLYSVNGHGFNDNNKQLINHLEQLSSSRFSGREPGTVGHTLASNYIAQHLISTSPLTNSITEVFTYKYGFNNKQGTNHLFIKTGSLYERKYIVITAHYDHLGKKSGKIYHGADDNASGVAALLTLKSWLSSTDTNYSIVLLATDAEEEGLYGAKAFLSASTVKKSDIIFNINLDMISYGTKQQNLYIVGTRKRPELKTLVEKVNQTAEVNFTYKSRLKDNSISSVKSYINLHKASDHYEFHKSDIPYLFVTGENHKNYHSTNDTFENINMSFYSEAFESIKNLILAVDQDLSQKNKI